MFGTLTENKHVLRHLNIEKIYFVASGANTPIGIVIALINASANVNTIDLNGDNAFIYGRLLKKLY